jgi:Zn-dependent peptidase ImmA (M78 family)
MVSTPGAIPAIEPSALRQLLETDLDSWSAVTLIQNGRKLVILNSAHSPARQNSSLAHELAHLILEHRPTQTFFGPGGSLLMKEFDREQEAEAECFSAVLLVPRDALISLLPRTTEEALAAHLGVSLDMLRMRRNVTGVDRQLNRRW